MLHAAPSRTFLARLTSCLPFCCALLLVILPVTATFLRASPSAADAELSLAAFASTFASSIAWALGLALCATLIAIPLTWSLRTLSLRWLALLALPLVLPSYLVSFSLTLLIQPQSAAGAWLAVQGQQNLPWLPTLVMKSIAFAGLSLWLAPLAALLLAPAVRNLPACTIDSLRLDAPRRHWPLQLCIMLRSPLLACVALLCVLMLGSAVPLHLANAPTLAVRAWASATLSPATLDAWRASAPVLLFAAVFSLLLTRALSRFTSLSRRDVATSNLASTSHTSSTTSPVTRRRRLVALAVPLILIALPFFAALANVRTLHSLRAFVHDAHRALITSFSLALVVGLLLALITALAWRARPLAHCSALTRIALAIMLTWAFTPGILVGHAYAMLASALPASSSTFDTLLLIAAHTSRFAGLFAAFGFVLASLEPLDRTHARTLDRAITTRGWFLATALGSSRAVAPVLCATAAAGACLSLHEIESTIMLQPPGTGSLSQTMLANLHFARSEELCAGIVTIILISLIPLTLATLSIIKLPKATSSLP